MKIRNLLNMLAAAVIALGASSAWAEGDAAKGAKVFKKKCKACHTYDAGGKNKIGPNLNGIVGRKAATKDGFRFSKAMKKFGGTWDEATLDKFLKKPKKLVKRTKMSFPGLKKENDRLNVIAFLKAQK